MNITDPHAGVLGHASDDPELLRQCIASGQVEGDQIVQHGVLPTATNIGCIAHGLAHPCEACAAELPYRKLLEHWTHESHLQTFEDRERFRKAAKELLGGVGVPADSAALPLTCWGLSSFCAEVGHKCRAAGACVYGPQLASGVSASDGETFSHAAPPIRMPLTLVDNEDRAGRIPGQPGYMGPGQ
jgi:hypothetical protein